MNTKNHQSYYTHEFPEWLIKNPRLINIVHVFNYFIQLRKWYIQRALTQLLNQQTQPFKLVDAGCGDGQYLFPFAKKYSTSFFKGIDRANSNIRFCNAYITESKLSNTQFEKFDIEEMIDHHQYDVAICLSVLPYCKNDLSAVLSLYNQLSNKGQLLIYVSVNNQKILPFYKWLFNRFENYETIQQNQRLYSLKGLISLLETAGFNLDKIKQTYGFFGKLSNELINSFLILFNHAALLIKPFIFLFFMLVYPIIFIFMMLDFLLPVHQGNGVLIIARK